MVAHADTSISLVPPTKFAQIFRMSQTKPLLYLYYIFGIAKIKEKTKQKLCIRDLIVAYIHIKNEKLTHVLLAADELLRKYTRSVY